MDGFGWKVKVPNCKVYQYYFNGYISWVIQYVTYMSKMNNPQTT